MAAHRSNRRALAVILTVVFFIAMFMGTGWGVLLVNPGVHDAHARYTLWGVPVIYLWGLLWYAVQLGVVVTAAFTLWSGDDDDETDTPPTATHE